MRVAGSYDRKAAAQASQPAKADGASDEGAHKAEKRQAKLDKRAHKLAAKAEKKAKKSAQKAESATKKKIDKKAKKAQAEGPREDAAP